MARVPTYDFHHPWVKKNYPEFYQMYNDELGYHYARQVALEIKERVKMKSNGQSKNRQSRPRFL